MPRNPFLDQVPVQEFPLTSYYLQSKLKETSISSSYALTASYAETASFASTASFALTASFASTASYVLQAVSASYATTASFVTASNVYGPFGLNSIVSASYATTASYAVTSSFALTSSRAISASYALTSSFSTTASYALNGGVTQLLAGANITLAPTNGLGQVTISSTAGGGGFNTATGSYGSFYDTTTQTNPVGNIPRSMSLNETDITNGVSISGSTNPYNTYIKTENAGVYNIQFSAQIDKTDSGTDEIVIWLRKNGSDLTDTATTITLSGNNDKQVAAWNWFVTSAANDYYQIIWISADTDMRLLAEAISGTHPGIPSVIVTANRVDQFLSNTGSFSGSFTGEFTGSLFGTSSLASTASWAQSASQATSASFATTASFATNALTASFLPVGTYAITASWAQSASQATSASFARTASFVNTASTNAFVQGGNSFGAQALLGTNDNQNLAFETSGSVRMFISSSGNVGIGTATPSEKLEVQGNIKLVGQIRNTSGNSSFWDTSNIITIGNAATVAQYIPYSGLGIGITTGLAATLQVRGASAVTGTVFLVQNSTPTNLFSVANNGDINFGATGQIVYIASGGLLRFGTSATNNYIAGLSGSPNGITIAGGGTGYGARFVRNEVITSTSGTLTGITTEVNGGFQPTSGTATLTMIQITGQINQTGTSSGITRGINVQQALTSAVNYRAIEATTDNSANHTLIKLNNGINDVFCVKGDNKIGFFGTTPVVQQTMGVATAGATYTAAEQAMIQKCWDVLRSFGLGN